MKRIVVFLFALIPLVAYNQETEKHHPLFFGLNGGVDYNFNAYRLTPDDNGFNYYSIDPHYNIGLYVGLMSKNRFRTRLEFKYVKMSYGMDWGNFNSTFDEMVTKLHNYDINLHVDYFVFFQNDLQFYISPALKSEFVFNTKRIRKDFDGSTETANYNILDDEHPKRILGGAISAIFKYNMNGHIGITVIPEYTIFFRNFVESNDKKYQRFGTNFGVEFKF
jgi:hypothetical protein